MSKFYIVFYIYLMSYDFLGLWCFWTSNHGNAVPCANDLPVS